MTYLVGLLVDNAEISKILSVNCGLYPFRKRISLFFRNSNSIAIFLNFGLVYFMNDLLQTDKKSLLSKSLGEFSID